MWHSSATVVFGRGVQRDRDFRRANVHPVVVVLYRGTSTGWRTEQKEALWSSRKGNAKSCTWGGTMPCPGRDWGLSSWKAALQRGIWGSWYSAGWLWPSNALWWQRPNLAALGGVLAARKGKGPFPPAQHALVHMRSARSSSGILNKEMWIYWTESRTGPWRWWRYWSIFFCDESLKELWLFNLEKRTPKEGINTSLEEVNKSEPDTSLFSKSSRQDALGANKE